MGRKGCAWKFERTLYVISSFDNMRTVSIWDIEPVPARHNEQDKSVRTQIGIRKRIGTAASGW